MSSKKAARPRVIGSDSSPTRAEFHPPAALPTGSTRAPGALVQHAAAEVTPLEVAEAVHQRAAGKTYASVGRDGLVKLWDAATGKEAAVLQGQGEVYTVQFRSDGKTLYTAGCDGQPRRKVSQPIVE